MKKLVMYGTIALALVLTASQLVFAGPKNPGQGDRQYPGGANVSVNWVSELKLTDDQITKIQTLLTKSNTETAPLYVKLHNTQTELRNLGWTKNYSDDKVKTLQDTIQSTHEAIQTSHQTMYEAIYNLLTDAQKKIYIEKGGCTGNPGDCRGPGNGGRKGRGGCQP